MKTEEEKTLDKILAGVETLTPELCELLEREYNETTYQVLEIWMEEHKEKEQTVTLSEWEQSNDRR